MLRTTGIGRALAVMLLDVAKGAAAVGIAFASTGGNGVGRVTGAAAVVGHIYPVWLRFHGGKGVAVAAGVFAVLTPLATAMAAALFLVIVWLDAIRLARIGRGDAWRLPPAAWLTGAPGAVVGAAAGTAALILFRHRANLRGCGGDRAEDLGSRGSRGSRWEVRSMTR